MSIPFNKFLICELSAYLVGGEYLPTRKARLSFSLCPSLLTNREAQAGLLGSPCRKQSEDEACEHEHQQSEEWCNSDELLPGQRSFWAVWERFV